MYLIKELKRYNNLRELENDPDVPQSEIDAALDAVGKSVLESTDGFVDMIKQRESDEAALREQISEAQKALTRHINGTARIKQSALHWMDLSGMTKLTGLRRGISISTTSKTVIDDETLIPDRFKKQKIEIVTSKADVKKAIESGETVDGAHVETTRFMRFN